MGGGRGTVESCQNGVWLENLEALFAGTAEGR